MMVVERVAWATVSLLAAMAAPSAIAAQADPPATPPAEATPPAAVAQRPAPVVLSGAGAYGWLSDSRMYRVGDVITILVDEYTAASADRSTVATEERSSELGGSASVTGGSSGFGQNGRLGTGVAGDSYRRGRDTRQDRLQSEITARVMEVNPDGSLRLEGRKKLVIDKHEQEVIVSGVIRSNDVSAGNTIESWRLAEAEILYATNGELGKPNKSIIMKLLGFIWP
ncbi:flagellar basal body L-ring protein FlgH [Gaopeijia maritima]|uniref:Flagellar basal body L-ring protein FlgH n=1 Tax=Gaopeijia maritima TaxID=3119007 RepID=A0ABU9EEM1_9BACT